MLDIFDSFLSISYSMFSLFLVVLILAFVHELGHFLAARSFGVKVNQFSIGMGKEIFGYTDSRGTRWRLSLFPIGGYVLMMGDDDISSTSKKKVKGKDVKLALYSKTLWEKSIIAIAGPLFNYILAFIIFVGVFWYQGESFTPPIVNHVVEGSAAEEIGLKRGDIILAINGEEMGRFEAIAEKVNMYTEFDPHITMTINRDGELISRNIVPKIRVIKDKNLGEVKMPTIGIVSGVMLHRSLSFMEAVKLGGYKVYSITGNILLFLKQLIFGQREIKQLAGVVKIAKKSAEVLSINFISFMFFLAVLSVNLGVFNLLPIPGLDGGHLLIYAVEGVLGREINQKMKAVILGICFFLLISLMIFTIVNDILDII